MIRAVVFDFDGVIANSEPLHFRAYRDVLTERGINLTESAYYEHYLGYDDVGAFRAIAADASVPISDGEIADLVAQKATRLEALEKAGSVLFPGAREAILRIADAWPIAIASGALKGEILRVLEHESLRSVLPCCRLGRRYAGEQAGPRPVPPRRGPARRHPWPAASVGVHRHRGFEMGSGVGSVGRIANRGHHAHLSRVGAR